MIYLKRIDSRNMHFMPCTIIFLILAVSFHAHALDPAKTSGKTSSSSPSLVIDLTDANFDNLTSSGSWMVEVYATWCSHCRQLEPQWILLSKELQAEGIQTAKINGPENPILMTRFAVAGFPSIFFLKGGSTWAYQGPRNVQEFKDFALSGHKKEASLPFYKSPTGLLGRALGRLHRLPGAVKEAYSFLRKDKGMSDLAIVGGFLAVPVIVGAFTICLVDGMYQRQARIQL